MTFETFVVAQDRLIVINNFKYNFDICHFFSDGIGTKRVTICFIKNLRLVHRFEEINSIRLVAFEIARTPLFDNRDNVITIV